MRGKMIDPRIFKLPEGHPRRVKAEEYYNSPKYIQDQVVLRVQNMLDAFAKERGYDSIISACSYATSKVEKFAMEANICVDLRDAAWSARIIVLT